MPEDLDVPQPRKNNKNCALAEQIDRLTSELPRYGRAKGWD
jgi:hypothetical protein